MRKEIIPPNQKAYNFAVGSLHRNIHEKTKPNLLVPYCFHVVAWGHGGQFHALWYWFRIAIKNKLETWRATLEIWYERRFLGKTDADFDRECEETAEWIRDVYKKAQGAGE